MPGYLAGAKIHHPPNLLHSSWRTDWLLVVALKPRVLMRGADFLTATLHSAHTTRCATHTRPRPRTIAANRFCRAGFPLLNNVVTAMRTLGGGAGLFARAFIVLNGELRAIVADCESASAAGRVVTDGRHTGCVMPPAIGTVWVFWCDFERANLLCWAVTCFMWSFRSTAGDRPVYGNPPSATWSTW